MMGCVPILKNTETPSSVGRVCQHTEGSRVCEGYTCPIEYGEPFSDRSVSSALLCAERIHI